MCTALTRRSRITLALLAAVLGVLTIASRAEATVTTNQGGTAQASLTCDTRTGSVEFWIYIRSDSAYPTQSVRWRVWVSTNGTWVGPLSWHPQDTINGATGATSSWYAPGARYAIYVETQWWNPRYGWYGAGEYAPAYQLRPGYLNAVYSGSSCTA